MVSFRINYTLTCRLIYQVIVERVWNLTLQACSDNISSVLFFFFGFRMSQVDVGSGEDFILEATEDLAYHIRCPLKCKQKLLYLDYISITTYLVAVAGFIVFVCRRVCFECFYVIIFF